MARTTPEPTTTQSLFKLRLMSASNPFAVLEVFQPGDLVAVRPSQLRVNAYYDFKARIVEIA
jgi:hypothetical protein